MQICLCYIEMAMNRNKCLMKCPTCSIVTISPFLWEQSYICTWRKAHFTVYSHLWGFCSRCLHLHAWKIQEKVQLMPFRFHFLNINPVEVKTRVEIGLGWRLVKSSTGMTSPNILIHLTLPWILAREKRQGINRRNK